MLRMWLDRQGFQVSPAVLAYAVTAKEILVADA